MICKKIVYLSGAPRVSTKSHAAISGARTRAIGIINGFKRAGYEVSTFIVGDRCRDKIISCDFDNKVKRSVVLRLLSDLARMAYAFKNGITVFFKFNGHPVCYEMLGLMQFLGWFLKKRGAFWILETNALLFKESHYARKATFFWRIARFIEKKCYQKADLIVTVTEETKIEVGKFADIALDKIVVIPNGVDSEAFNPESVEAKRFFLDPVIGFVGVMYEWQGLDMLLKAVHEIKSEGIYCKIVLVGDGPEYEKLKKTAEDLGMKEDLVFTGRVPPEAVPALIKGMDLCYSGQVFTTGGETSRSPIKTYEYLAMKKPVISSLFEDARKVIQDGFNGYLFNSEKNNALVEVLLKIFKEKARWQVMGENGYRIVSANHTWEKRVQLLLEKINKLWR
jgi:glycosyltransferase involved in cell wall biosynthesis